MIPLRDANPTRRPALVTLLLVIACCVAFGLELGLLARGDAAFETAITDWGVVPGRLTEAWGDGAFLSTDSLTLLTSQFLHAGWLHLLGNLLYLWIFGNNVEDRLGRAGFLLFYLAGGVLAGLAQVAIDPTSPIPTIGASGAIAATLGAYLVFFPGARVTSLVFLGFFYQLVRIPAAIVLGLWFVLQLLDGIGSLGPSQGGGVAFLCPYRRVRVRRRGRLVHHPARFRPADDPDRRGIIGRWTTSSSRCRSRAFACTCCRAGTW